MLRRFLFVALLALAGSAQAGHLEPVGLPQVPPMDAAHTPTTCQLAGCAISGNVSATPILPTGNAYPTFSLLNVQANASLAAGYPTQPGQTRQSSREYMLNLGMVDSTGGYAAALGSPASLADPTDKVTLYAGMECQPGGGPCWTVNTSLLIDSGFASLGHGASGYELDMSNNDKDSGGGDGLGGLVEPGYYGLTVTGAGQYAVTAAYSIGGPGTHAIFHRGLVDSSNAVDQCLVCEYGNAYRVVDARGTGLYAVDASKGTYASGLNTLIGAPMLSASKADGTGGMQVVTVGSDNFVNIAPLGAAGVRFGANISPNIANAQFYAATRSDGTGAQLIGLGGTNILNIGPAGTSGISFGANIVNGATFTQGLTAQVQSAFSNGAFVDPGPGVGYDAKFGGPGSGIAVNGPSLFKSTVTASGYTETLTTPASSSAACTAGQFTDDANYHYVCVAANTWKRIALSPF